MKLGKIKNHRRTVRNRSKQRKSRKNQCGGGGFTQLAISYTVVPYYDRKNGAENENENENEKEVRICTGYNKRTHELEFINVEDENIKQMLNEFVALHNDSSYVIFGEMNINTMNQIMMEITEEEMFSILSLVTYEYTGDDGKKVYLQYVDEFDSD